MTEQMLRQYTVLVEYLGATLGPDYEVDTSTRPIRTFWPTIPHIRRTGSLIRRIIDAWNADAKKTLKVIAYTVKANGANVLVL